MEEDLSREAIVLHLQRGLEKEPAVLAMWLEGSFATGQVDDLSDIDLVVDVGDGSEEFVFQRAEMLLAELGQLATRLELDIDHRFLRHRLYRLEGLYQVPDISAFEARLETADDLFRAAIDAPAMHEPEHPS